MINTILEKAELVQIICGAKNVRTGLKVIARSQSTNPSIVQNLHFYQQSNPQLDETLACE